MPTVNGCHVSKKSIEDDVKFLHAQKLSAEQVDSIKAYYLQRITGYAWQFTMFSLSMLLLFFGLGYFLAQAI